MKKFCLLLISVLFFLSSQKAFAKEPTGIEIYPAFLDITTDSNQESKTIPLTIVNHSTRQITLDLFPIDFRQQDEFGSIGFVGLNASYSYSLSSFLSFEKKQLILEPKEKQTFDVILSNRDDLSPGGHYAAVVAKLVSSQDAQGSGTEVSPSVSSLLLVHKKGGERFNLSLLDSSWPARSVEFFTPSLIRLKFQNEGNIHVIPYGKVEIKDMLGRVIGDGYINPSSLIVLPESRRYIEADLKRVSWELPLSLNTMTIRGNDSLKKTQYVYKEVYLFVNPYALAIVVLLVVFIVVKKFRKNEKN